MERNQLSTNFQFLIEIFFVFFKINFEDTFSNAGGMVAVQSMYPISAHLRDDSNMTINYFSRMLEIYHILL